MEICEHLFNNQFINLRYINHLKNIIFYSLYRRKMMVAHDT